MINYKCCTEVDIDTIFEAFQVGFSDYIIKIEMTKDFFIKRFFGPEGNSLEHSFIAFDEDNGVGVILGGMKVYEGIKTLRCGALCVHPDYRGVGVSKKLFDMHRQIAIENQCKQLFLEVIAGNDRAINFYEKIGYEKIYDLSYYSHKEPNSIVGSLSDSIDFNQKDISILQELSPQVRNIHINWQNDFDYIKKLDGQVHYGAYKEGRLIGALTIHHKGKISFLWIHPEYRNNGIAKSLIAHAVKELDIETLVISFPNNANLKGFVELLKFTKDKISQYEMYLTL